MKLFKHKEKEEYFLSLSDDVVLAISDGSKYTGNKDMLEEIKQVIESKPVIKDFKRYHITEETATLEKFKEWHLKDILFVPVDGKEIAFRVEHITEHRVYFVAVDAVGKSTMNDMSDFLDDFLKKMPDSLVGRMLEMEHSVEGKIIRKSKLMLLSHGNVVYGDTRCDGADDISFLGLMTEAERCKNFDGKTCRYWTDTPYAGSSMSFRHVDTNGWASNAYAGGANGVAVCFSIYRYK